MGHELQQKIESHHCVTFPPSGTSESDSTGTCCDFSCGCGSAGHNDRRLALGELYGERTPEKTSEG